MDELGVMSTKVCTTCSEMLPLSSFYKDPNKKDGLYSRCKDCHKAATAHYASNNRKVYSGASRKWYHANKLKAKNLHLRRKYGISIEQYLALVDAQGNTCAVCKTPDKTRGQASAEHWCVDHNHQTGKVRGLLCHHCNRALGLLNDNVAHLTTAVQYLTNAETKTQQLLDQHPSAGGC
jgi:hypothetical protein